MKQNQTEKKNIKNKITYQTNKKKQSLKKILKTKKYKKINR